MELLNIEAWSLTRYEYRTKWKEENSRVTMWIMTAKTAASDTDANNIEIWQPRWNIGVFKSNR